jgi:hypothetical protein
MELSDYEAERIKAIYDRYYEGGSADEALHLLELLINDEEDEN